MASRIKVVNKTTYPDAEVRTLIRRVARDAEISDVTFTVGWRRGGDGYASGSYREYWYPSRGEDRPQIRVSLPKPGVPLEPYQPYARKGEQGREFQLNSWQEACVAIAAHEAEHHRQAARNGWRSPRAVARTGRRGQHRFVEVECDLAAYRAVKRMARP